MQVLHKLVSFIRARGEIGNGAWVAMITGLDPEFGLKREFLKARDSRSATRKRGHLTFEITEPGFYQFSGFGSFGMAAAKLVSMGGTSGFIQIDGDGTCRDVTQAEIFRHFKQVAAKVEEGQP